MNTNTHNKLQVILTVLLAILFLLLPSSTGRALAQPPSISDDEVNRIAEQLFCPVCENVPLDECQTAACEQWRELIRQKLGEGWSDDEIKEFFVAQYGDRVLGEPPRRGAHWLLYGLPPAIFLLGLGLLINRLRRGRGSSLSPDSPVEDPYLQRVEQDLDRLEDV
jgi:cytochrome c-type biogenesis protein CcmH